MSFPVLRNPAFRALWIGQAVSQLGDSFYYVIFMFMVKRITGSSAMVGYVGALETIPFLLFGPHAGVLADRIDRRRIMLNSDLLSGSALVAFGALIWIFREPPVVSLLVTPFILSAVRCYFMPAKSAAIPQLVPKEMVLQANSVSSMTQTVFPLISLSLTASVLSILYTLSPLWFYLSAVGLNSLSFFGSAFFIRLLPTVMPQRDDGHDTHPFSDFKEGIRYIRTRHDLKVLTVLLTVFRLSVAPFFVVYLAANEAWFGGKPQTIAWFEFSFFAGMVVASLAMAKRKPRRPLLWFSSGLAICGAGVGLMAFSPVLWLFMLWNIVCGLVLPPADIPVATYLQLSVPDGYRGRVNAVREMIATGMMPIGLALGGILVSRYGVVVGFLAMGAGMIGGCLFGLLDSKFRNCEMPEEEPLVAAPLDETVLA